MRMLKKMIKRYRQELSGLSDSSLLIFYKEINLHLIMLSFMTNCSYLGNNTTF